MLELTEGARIGRRLSVGVRAYVLAVALLAMVPVGGAIVLALAWLRFWMPAHWGVSLPGRLLALLYIVGFVVTMWCETRWYERGCRKREAMIEGSD